MIPNWNSHSWLNIYDIAWYELRSFLLCELVISYNIDLNRILSLYIYVLVRKVRTGFQAKPDKCAHEELADATKYQIRPVFGNLFIELCSKFLETGTQFSQYFANYSYFRI